MLADPAKRDELLKKLEQWLNDQLAGLGCDASKFLLEAMQSKKPIAAQLGELKAALDQQTAEVAAQVAVAAATTKGLGALASLASKGGKLGGLAEDIGSVLNKAGKDTKVPERKPTPPAHKPGTPEGGAPKGASPTTAEKPAGGAKGPAAAVACKTGCNVGGMPVNTAYGCKVLFGSEDLDFDLPAPLPLPWQRTYASDFAQIGWLGQGWSTPLSLQIQRVADGLVLVDEQGRRIPLPGGLPLPRGLADVPGDDDARHAQFARDARAERRWQRPTSH